MQNLTLAIEKDVLLEARKLALERGTTVNKLVRDYLAELIQQRDRQREALASLRKAWKRGVVDAEPRTWKREDIYAERLDRYGR